MIHIIHCTHIFQNKQHNAKFRNYYEVVQNTNKNKKICVHKAAAM